MEKNISEFAFVMGQSTGILARILKDEDAIAYFAAGGVTREELVQHFEISLKIANAFYQGEKL